MKAMRHFVLQILIVSTTVLLGAVSVGYGRVIYVDDDANGLNDGSSWVNAYKFLQDALADANSAEEKPVEIRVAHGIYKPDSSSAHPNGTGDREATFRLLNDVALKGGYAGFGETDPNSRDIAKFETILSGDLADNDIDVNDPCNLLDEPTRGENSYHVVTGSGTNQTALLDGVIIVSGNANGPSWYTMSGGGISNYNGSPNVSDCTVSTNSAFLGGGMANEYFSSPSLIDCRFLGNFAEERGGGILNEYHSSPTFTRCVFNENWAVEYGGGMENITDADVSLSDCEFERNVAVKSGGGVYNSDSSPTFIRCVFVGNEAGDGGAICNSFASKANLINSVIVKNYADRGAGIHNSYWDKVFLTNCTFAWNLSEKGCAIACDYTGDRTPSNIKVTNCILWDSESEIWNNDGSIIEVSFSDVQGGETVVYDPYDGLVWGLANIDADPLFGDPNNGDCHLKSQAGRWEPKTKTWIKDDGTSPCIDAGDPRSPVGSELGPNGDRINMGAYGGTMEASRSYSESTPCKVNMAGDINGDCIVNFKDFALMAYHWLEDRRPVNSNSIIKDGIEYYIQTDKFVYELGEEVEMLYRVTNLRNEDVTFGFGSTVQNDFIVQAKLGDNFKEIWLRTYFSGGTGIPSHFSLSPNGSKEFRDIWPQIDARGTVTPVDDIPATPGTYKILGCLTYGYESSSKVGVDIRIVP